MSSNLKAIVAFQIELSRVFMTKISLFSYFPLFICCSVFLWMSHRNFRLSNRAKLKVLCFNAFIVYTIYFG